MDTLKAQSRFPRRSLAVAAAVAIVAVGALVYYLWPADEANDAMAPLRVEAGPLADSVPLSAVLTPVRSVAISTTTGGTVIDAPAFGGQSVRTGDPLVQLSNPDLERQWAEAQSELAGAKADLASMRADAIDEQASLKMAQINAQNELELAQLQLEAEQKLQQAKIISAMTLKKTELARVGKQAMRDYAIQHLSQAQAASEAKIAAAVERVRVLQARCDALSSSVDALILRAPFDGIVAKIDAKPGAAVPAGTQLAEVMTPALQANLEVAEQVASQVRPGQQITLAGGVTGRVLSLAPSDEGGIVRGRAVIDGSTAKLRANTVLPGRAVIAPHGSGVFIRVDGVALSGKTLAATIERPGGERVEREIRFGPRYGDQLVILKGAVPGEKIVSLQTDQAP